MTTRWLAFVGLLLLWTSPCGAAGSLAVTNTFAGLSGNVSAAKLDTNYTDIVNYVNNREITLGLLTNRPAASISGRLYFATDGPTLYEDNGSTWTAVGLGSPIAVLNGGTGLTIGTSGGILGFTATGTLASSALLAANAFVTGGGAGATPTGVAITGLVKGNGASAPAAYGGTSCTNQFPRSLDLNGAATCASVANADLAGSIDVTTKLTGVLPAAQFPALTGPVTTVAGGLGTTIGALQITNAMIAANTIDLTAKVTGILPSANGGVANAFFTVAGPATSVKTYTFTNASGTIASIADSPAFSGLPTWTSAGMFRFTNTDSQIGLAGVTDPGWALGAVQVSTSGSIHAVSTGIGMGYNVYNDGADKRIVADSANRVVTDGNGDVRMMTAVNAAAGSAITWVNVAQFGVAQKIFFTNPTAEGATKDSLCRDSVTTEVLGNAASSCLVSSARFKTWITTLPPTAGTGILGLLRPVRYIEIGSTDYRLGLIAEELALISPAFVDYDHEGRPNAVRYDAVLAQIIAELQDAKGLPRGPASVPTSKDPLPADDPLVLKTTRAPAVVVP